MTGPGDRDERPQQTMRASRTRPTSSLARPAVGATRQRKQHLARVLEITPPQQRGALAREAIRIVGRDVVIGDDHVPGRRHPALRAPARRARLTALGPVNDRVRAHARTGLRRWSQIVAGRLMFAQPGSPEPAGPGVYDRYKARSVPPLPTNSTVCRLRSSRSGPSVRRAGGPPACLHTTEVTGSRPSTAHHFKNKIFDGSESRYLVFGTIGRSCRRNFGKAPRPFWTQFTRLRRRADDDGRAGCGMR